jgi:hypothetical protein
MPRQPPATAWQLPAAGSTYTRHKSIAQMVRDATNGGLTLIEGLVAMATDTDAAYRDRCTATGMLLERGFGKAVETSLTLSVDASSSDALSALADAELERLAQTLAPHTVRPVVVLPAATLSPALDSLPDAPPEALEAPLRPPVTVTPQSCPETTTPTEPLPPPLARGTRRRIVVPRPPVSGQAGPDVTQDVVDRSDIDPKG